MILAEQIFRKEILLVVFVLGTAVPRGAGRTMLILAWLILFPIGGWQILKKPRG